MPHHVAHGVLEATTGRWLAGACDHVCVTRQLCVTRNACPHQACTRHARTAPEFIGGAGLTVGLRHESNPAPEARNFTHASMVCG
eukprot:3471166-Prymnesium_polylepis.2